MNSSANERRDVYLTIVPHDLDFGTEDALDTIVDITEEQAKDDTGKPIVPTPDDEPFSIEPASPRVAEPATRRSKAPLLVAGALGGGMIVGGGAVAFLGLLAMLGLGAVGGVAWYVTSAVDEVAPVEAIEAPAPVEDVVEPMAEDEAPVDEEVVDAEPAPAPVEAPVDAAPARPAPAPEAPAETPSPDYAQAPAAPAAAPAPEEMPADEVMVKLLTDPPAATVTIDGTPMGRTPLKTSIPAGSHSVVITSGKATGEFRIDAAGGDRFCFKAKGRKVNQTSCN